MSEYRCVVLSVEFVNSMIGRSLEPYLGPAALYNDYSNIIRYAAEAMLYPYNDLQTDEAWEMISSYGVDEVVSQNLFGEVLSVMNRTITPLFHKRIGEHLFEVALQPGYALYIEDIGRIPDDPPVSIESTFYNNQQSISQDVDAGHWVPLRVRESVGLG